MKNSQELVKKSHSNNDLTLLQKSTSPDTVVEMKYLARSWLDQFEKEVFEGKTIDELLDTRTYE